MTKILQKPLTNPQNYRTLKLYYTEGCLSVEAWGLRKQWYHCLACNILSSKELNLLLVARAFVTRSLVVGRWSVRSSCLRHAARRWKRRQVVLYSTQQGSTPRDLAASWLRINPQRFVCLPPPAHHLAASHLIVSTTHEHSSTSRNRRIPRRRRQTIAHKNHDYCDAVCKQIRALWSHQRKGQPQRVRYCRSRQSTACSLVLTTRRLMSRFILTVSRWRWSVVNIGGPNVETPQAARTRCRRRRVGWLATNKEVWGASSTHSDVRGQK